VDDARNCPRDGYDNPDHCRQLAYSIDVLVRDLRFRRWDLQRKGYDKGHIDWYNKVRADLEALVNIARQKGCPYNKDADREITLSPKYPTPNYN
jgi:hypothetical protein